MFEYLMPLLVMPTYENTLLDQTYLAAVQRQIDYGRQRGVPWGMSESGYNTVDVHLNYQYRAFGVPGLGLKRGLGEDLVVAPYASALALMVAPEAACLNLQRLAGAGFAGRLGLYEAIDYTPVAAATRRAERRGPVVHGAPPGDEPALLRLRASGAADAATLRVRPALAGDLAIAAGANPEGHPVAPDCNRSIRTARRRKRTGFAGARSHQPEHGDSRGAIAVERTLSRDGHQCGRREQPVEGSRRDPLARGYHVGQLGQFLLSPRRSERRVLVHGVSAHAQADRTLRSALFGRPSGVSTSRFRVRDAYRDRGFSRG